ncbi:MAG: DUF58 domain-containing protein [Armatimonadetes bacterium]|nr:DUF58 domain-containing protein [Armatimonadota bacterium]MDW8123003.1 DUF58 domain-containing protein [Armatimonadota bacterium]
MDDATLGPPGSLLAPRLRRTAVITAIVCFGLVSLVLGIDLLFLATLSLAFVTGAAYLFGAWNLRPMKVALQSDPEVVEGQPGRVDFTLINEGRISRYLVEMAVDVPQGAVPVSDPLLVFGQILPGQSATATLKMVFQRRGLYPVGGGVLISQDPIGLFVAERKVRPQSQVLVYPRPKPVTLAPTGQEQRIRWEDVEATIPLPSPSGTDFYGVRDYRPGDDLRKIHWKMTAHRTNLMVLETLPHPQQGAFLFLDRHPAAFSTSGGLEQLDELCRVAAYLVRHWILSGYQVHFWAPPDPVQHLDKDWYPAWRALALIEPQPYTLHSLDSVAIGVVLTTDISPMLGLFRRSTSAGWTVWTPRHEGGRG